MTTAATITAKLTLNTSDFDKGISKAEKKSDGFVAKMGKVGAKMTKIGAGMTAGLTLPIIGAGIAVVKSASDMEESMNAVNTVFGEGASIIEDYSKTSAEAVGLAAQDFNQLSAVTGSFLQNLGFDEAAAAEETIKLTERAADMASVFNTDVDQALGAIQSGLKGEFNPLEQFGIKMNAAAINAKALELGLVDITHSSTDLLDARRKSTKAEEAWTEAVKESGPHSDEAVDAQIKWERAQIKLNKAMEGNVGPITDNAKATAALQIIMEQTERISGDFAATSDGLANKTRIVKAQFKDMTAQLGKQLLPIALQLADFVGNLIDKFSALTPEQQKTTLAIIGIIAVAGPLITVIGGIVTALAALTFPILLIIGVIALLALAWKNNWGGIREKTAEFVEKMKPIIAQVIEWFKTNIPIALKALADFWNNVLLPVFKAIWKWLSTNIPIALQKLKEFWVNVLLPAIMVVWSWIKTNLFPLFEAIGKLIKAVVLKAFEAFIGFMQNVGIPVLKRLFIWFNDKVLPVLKTVAAWLKDKLAPAWERLTRVIRGTTDWIGRLAGSISSLSLPAWLTPGSPTPFEMGLKGINAEMNKLSGSELPSLNMGLNLGGPPLAAAGAGGGGNSTTVIEEGAFQINDPDTGRKVIAILERLLAGESI